MTPEQTFISVVSSATAAPRNDRARVELILFAQYHLFKARARGVSPTVGKDTVWRNFGHMAFNTIAVSVREDKRRPPPHWEPFEAIRLLDNVLRRQLVWSAVLQDGPKSMEEDRALLRVCMRRTVEALERADIPLTAKRELRAQGDTIMSVM